MYHDFMSTGRKYSSNRVALITGSSTGIGFATAELLLSDGWSVQFHSEMETEVLPGVMQELLSKNPERTSYIQADLSVPEAASKKILQHVSTRWSRLDALVVSAAVTHHGPIEAITEENWHHLLSVNVIAPFFVATKLQGLLAKNGGSIVFVSSTNAKRVNINNTLYDVSKAALNQLSRALALELRHKGVRVNTIMPGGTLTPMLEKWMSEYSDSPESALRHEMDSGFLATPTQIAGAIVSLLEDRSGWINGAAIEVDGGLHLGEFWRA